METRGSQLCLLVIGGIILSACASEPKRMNVAAPLPPMSDVTIGIAELGEIQPAYGLNMALNATPEKKSCRFSSFQRKHTLGYEFDESHHLALRVSPSVDIWDPSDIETKVSLRFTKSLSGPANKRPDCTFAKGFYGLLPYAANQGVNLNGFFNGGNIKSMVEDKLHEREEKQRAREAEILTGI